ncbi:MAG: MFS transporter [Clostridiales bacterium]|nr:MFS transporter [Clostridiales bacterium]
MYSNKAAEASKYKITIYSCYIGYITQAIVNIFPTLLFIRFQNEFGIPLSQITSLITLNFLFQLSVDLISSKLISKTGYRKAVVFAHISAVSGLVSYGFLPYIAHSPYIGLIISVLLCSIGGGIIEVVISPIVEACPTVHKAQQMSLLHSFYCWGSVAVVLLSTLFFNTAGLINWRILSALWALIPLTGAILFSFVPILSLEETSESTISFKKLLLEPIFWILMLMMVCSGASELTVSQWASDFAEAGLGVDKTIGDLMGPCMFSILMGTSRVIYAKIGEKVNVSAYMLASSVLCVAGYLVISLSPSPWLSLISCGVVGFSVGIMWPGTFSVAAANARSGGTAMFALLALGGDLGCAAGPTLVGTMTGVLDGDIKRGMIFGVVFPIALIITLIIMKRYVKKQSGKT